MADKPDIAKIWYLRDHSTVCVNLLRFLTTVCNWSDPTRHFCAIREKLPYVTDFSGAADGAELRFYPF